MRGTDRAAPGANERTENTVVNRIRKPRGDPTLHGCDAMQWFSLKIWKREIPKGTQHLIRRRFTAPLSR